jgi:DNA-binding NarL/FixJ family response regulator/tetratricopeptide (TPR) repeat protein
VDIRTKGTTGHLHHQGLRRRCLEEQNRGVVTQHALVGRAEERAALRSAVADAVSGVPSLVLVRGEAGIGKTWLAREAAERARAEGHHVLIGQCLRFGAEVTSYLPFSQAIGHWLTTGVREMRTALGAEELHDLVPSLGGPSDGRVLVELTSVLDRLQRDRPTVLVLDDLQWADPSSLDVVSYLVAGFAPGQRLAVLATCRDTELVEGHRLHGWLADAERMPGVSSVDVARMDLVGIEEMILARGEATLDTSSAHEIFGRSSGNPYLVDLLLRHSGATSSTGGAPRLDQALLASWHRLSLPGRRLTQVLAVAGGPVAVPVLLDLGRRFGLDHASVGVAEREAASEGITVRTDTGSVWFRHPLLAETIATTLDAWQSAAIHADLARAWSTSDTVDERDRATALALHHVAAGDVSQGLDWSLRAADAAEAIRSWPEVSHHLSTAVSLLPSVPADDVSHGSHVDLLVRAARACEYAGDDREAVGHYEAALSMVDRASDPRRAARFLLELHILRDIAGYGTAQLSMAEPLEVLELTQRQDASPERSLALTQLAFAEVFNGLPTAVEHAEAAVQLAETADSRRALTWALGARSQTRWGTEAGVVDAERALALAEEADEPQLLCRFTIFLSNSYQSMGRYADAAAATERGHHRLLDEGQPDYAASVGAIAAWWHFQLGNWGRLRPLVRELLTIARGRNNAGAARCVAALLSAHEGGARAADLHLLRAHELLPTAAPVGDILMSTEVQVSIVVCRFAHALDLVDLHMAEALRIDAVAADELLEYASRAAAAAVKHDPAGAGRDGMEEQFRRIETSRGTEPEPFAPAGPQDLVHPALGALHAAQRAEVLGADVAVSDLWEAACRATERAGLRTEHARALSCLAHHLLTHRSDRGRAVGALAAARTIADELGAAVLLHDIEDLALQSHVHLADAEGRREGPREVVVPADPPLTPREQEVLAGLLSGETYAQIAAHLFITDKTVSTHVSNLLRKTGTSSRIELAELARRAPEA